MSGPGGGIPSQLVEAVAAARQVTVLTGAGVSAESGIPTFREAQTGLWARYDPQQLATPEAFAADPRLVWRWYQWRRALVCRARPNPGHRALAELETLLPGFTLVTQNVDGLHRQAGSRNVIEFHGNIRRNRCSREGTVSEARPSDTDEPPVCLQCGALLRPDVVWFGEAIPGVALQGALEAAARADVFLAVGTSAAVFPAAGLAERALAAGAVVAEVNPDHTPLSGRATWTVAAPAAAALPALVAGVRAGRPT